jgi:Protein of unknown function (DUF2845)
MKRAKQYLFILIVVVVFGCGKSIRDVKIGMTAKEVIEIAGEPTRTSLPLIGDEPNLDVNGEFTNPQWTYAGYGHIYFENGKVSEINIK